MADCEILGAGSDFKINYNRILEDLKENLTWKGDESSEEIKEGSWYCFLSAARGMLHQYTGQQYSNINSHYSPLNSCSQLVQQTFSQPSKIAEVNDRDSERDSFFSDEKIPPNESEEGQTQQQHFGVEEISQNSANTGKELVPNSELYEQTTAADKECDNETSQVINDEQNNNVQKSQIKSEPFDYQKFASVSEENEMIPFIDLDMETIINASVNESEEYKQKIQTTANEINKICDENESNFRLPGFHQAFGSTEIGRYVHQKDFIEQTATQPIIIQQSKPTMLPCNPSNVVPNGLSSPKTKSRCNKRIKPPIEANRQQCWNYEPETVDAPVCTQLNGTSSYYKRKEMRRTKPNQNSENNSATGFYQADDYYNCSSPYYGGCSDYPNCEYYRYQQNSQYQNYNAPSYNSHSNYNGFNYSDEHSQRLSYGSPSMSYSHNQNWRGERFFPYGEQFSYRYRQGNSSPYMYQQFVPQNQHVQSQQSYNYGYNSYPAVPNYNYF